MELKNISKRSQKQRYVCGKRAVLSLFLRKIKFEFLTSSTAVLTAHALWSSRWSSFHSEFRCNLLNEELAMINY